LRAANMVEKAVFTAQYQAQAAESARCKQAEKAATEQNKLKEAEEKAGHRRVHTTTAPAGSGRCPGGIGQSIFARLLYGSRGITPVATSRHGGRRSRPTR